MTKEEKALAIGKKIQCVIGIIFLIPAIMGAVAFTLKMLGVEGRFVELRNLDYVWCTLYDKGGGMSAAPIYMGMLAMVGAYLTKDSLKYFFMGEEQPKKEEPKVGTNQI